MLKKLIDRITGGLTRHSAKDVIQLFTPATERQRGPGGKLVLAGLTFTGLAVASLWAMGSLLMLLAALGVIYFLLTQVLGVRLDVDPQAFAERARAYTAHTRN